MDELVCMGRARFTLASLLVVLHLTLLWGLRLQREGGEETPNFVVANLSHGFSVLSHGVGKSQWVGAEADIQAIFASAGIELPSSVGRIGARK